MSNITEWIKYELYPNLFDVIDIALPEHNFKRFAGGWRSKTYLDGSPHKDRSDKTVVTKKALGIILEQGGDYKSLVDYVMDRDGIEFIEAVKLLAEVANVKVPEGDVDQESYKKYKERATILEECNSYFIYCLDHANGADKVKDYLHSRGYSEEDIKAMEIGYIPSQEKLNKYLKGKGYSQSQIKEVVKFNKGIGSTHSLSIPYRSGETIKGFKFRTIEDHKPKYYNSTGLDRSGGFFNISPLKGYKDLVIVEGELDSLHATAKGVDNIVATGGSSINAEQVKDAIKRGAKSFTLCFDTEPDKDTDKGIASAIEVIKGEGVNKVYIVNLPDLGGGKTDPDKLIKEKGVEAFKQSIKEALPYYEHQLQQALNKVAEIEQERGLSPKEVDRLLEQVITIATNIPDPTDRDRFKKRFTSLEGIKDLGITEESLSITVDRLTSTRDKEEQKREFNSLLFEVSKLQQKGETDKALDLLENRVKEVKLQDKTTEFSQILKTTTEEEIKERLSNKPDSLHSGYNLGGETLFIPSGAISVFTAPTSHGKTTFLINLALNISESQDKEVYLFSYEEDGDSILTNTLNTYTDKDISANNRKTLKSYFSTGSTQYIREDSKDYFKEKKDRFFSELIETGRLNINYSNYNSDTLIEAIRYIHKHAKPAVILIDYIQLLNLPKGKYKTYSRQEEMKEICKALKDIAVETGLPIILGAQFNREVTNHLKIHATKIGEAGDIERIANLIVGFWNNNFKAVGSDSEINEIENTIAPEPDTIHATILKQRGGRVGLTESFLFNGNTGKISNRSNTSNLFK